MSLLVSHGLIDFRDARIWQIGSLSLLLIYGTCWLGFDQKPHAIALIVATAVVARLDDVRRRRLMRTHSALHVVSGVVFRDFAALVTGSNMEPLAGRLDFNLPEVSPGFKEELERVVNEEILADRAITARVVPRAEAVADPEVMRTAQFLIPDEVEEIRIIDVAGLDKQADSGTHVASTRQIGEVRIAKVESKGRGFRRVRVELPGS